MNESGEPHDADKTRDIFERHLRETKAKLKSRSFEELVIRKRSEQEFRKILEDLREYIRSQEIMPFLSLDKETAEFPPDFIVWKDEFRIPLFLVEIVAGDRQISKKKLSYFSQYLKRTDSTEILVVWMSSPDFPSKLLQVEEIGKFIRSLDDSFSFPDAEPFKKVVTEWISKKDNVWPVPKSATLSKMMLPEIVLKSLESTFSRGFEMEARRRKPHLDLKKEALQKITPETMQRVCIIISEYMKGELDIKEFAGSFKTIAKSIR